MKLNRMAGVLLTAIVCLSSALNAADMTSTKINGCKGPVLCSSFPFLENCNDCCHTWHLDVGLLYEQPVIPGNTAGQAFIPQWLQTGTTFVNQSQTNLNVCLDYALGLTVSAGYLMHHDQWYVGANFDWLSTSNDYLFNDSNTFYIPNGLLNSGTNATNQGIFQGITFDPNTDTFDSIDYNAGVDIYALDVMLSRGSYHSRCFSYDPWMGVEAIWFTTTQNAKYSSTILPSGSNAVLNVKFDNWGAGPAFGFNGEYHITHGLSLFSDSNLAVLIGKVQGTITSTLTANGSDITDPRVVSFDDTVRCAYMVPVRSIIGVKLSSYCLEERHHVAIKLGYDVRVVAIPQLHSPTGFSLNGLYADLVWNF